jgi:hypothetical protein
LCREGSGSKVNLAAGFPGTREFEIGTYQRRPAQRLKNSASLRRIARDRPADGGSNPGRIWAIFCEAPRDGADQVTICIESEHLESGDPPLRQTGAIISQRSLLCCVAHSSLLKYAL